ncbi:unnamed protein product, partial [Rotaria sp. Silwood1]
RGGTSISIPGGELYLID